jgi:hypothetical protein
MSHNLHVSLEKWHLSLVRSLCEKKHCLLLAGVPVHCTAVYKNSSTKMSLPYHGILEQHYVIIKIFLLMQFFNRMYWHLFCNVIHLLIFDELNFFEQ